MNHIYKVIWNKAKHCYTVVSEIAKSHSTSSVTKKKVSIAAILAAGMLSGFSPMVSGAADTTNSGAVVYDQNQTSLKSTNSGSVGKDAIALGKGASAVANSIAIGNGAYTQNGHTNGESVALGNGAGTGARSTSIGAKAIGGREGTITIGANANNGALYATIVGTDSSINYVSTNSGAVSTVIGSKNSIKNDDKTYSGVASSILGAANTIENSNGVTIQGTGNTVTGAYKDMNLSFSDLWNLSLGDYSVLAEKESGAIAIIGGANTISSQTSSTVIGFGNTLKGEDSTGVFTAGSHNTLTNVSNSLVMGDNNTLEDRKNVISLGNQNTVTADDAVAIGNGTTVIAKSGVAIGVASLADRVAGKEKGVVGEFAPEKIDATNQSTWTSTAGAVSVGDTVNNITRQITNVAAGSEDTDAVNVAQLNQVNSKAETAQAEAAKGWNISTSTDGSNATKVAPGDTVAFAGDTNISVSNNGKNVRVKLKKDLKDLTSVTTENAYVTNVDASKKDSVTNVEYVKSQIADVALSAGDGISITDKKINVKLKDGEENLKVDADGLALKDTLTLGSNTTVDYVTVDGVKGTVWAGHAVSAGNVNMDGDSGEITGLTNTTLNSKDFATTGRAATEEQLKLVKNQADSAATEASKHSKVVNGSNITVEETDQDGQKTYKVGLNKDIDVNSVQTNALNSKYNLSVGTANENGIMPFFVNSTGDFYAAHNKFHVDKDGKVTATAGEIGNVVLQNGVYYGHSTLQDGSLLLTDDNGNHSYIDAKGAKLGKVTVAEDGKITGVAAGAITADSTDAVNGSQLHAVATEAGKHSKVVNGSNINVEETDVDGQKIYKVGLNDDILLGKLTGNNVSISGTNGTIETTGYIATKDRIIADKGAQLADITVSGNAISNGEAKVALDGAAGTAGMINGKGASLYMQDGYTVINSKVSFDQNGKISGVAAGAVTADSTDAVNGSQLHEVATEAGKHSKVVNGSNINVEETNVDGQKIYKVGLNDDILLGKLTGNNVSISGTNGTIETTGYIATKDRIIADKGAQLADITVSGNAISNGEAKVALDGAAGTAGMINGKGASLYMQDGTTVINNKVGIDQEGKITGVAAGEISATSKDAVNGSQLKQTNDKVDALDKRVTQNEADIKQNKADIAQNKADIAQNKADIAQNKADIAQNKADIQKNTVAIEQNKTDIATNKENINKLDTRVTNVEELAKKHTTVAAGDNITVTEGTNKDGGKNYTVAMKKDITVDSVKAGDTTINTEGVRIGDTTSLKKDSLTIGGKTYVTDKGLNANNQTITNVADGKVEKGSKDAINGSQLFATNQQVAQNAQSISKLGNRINKVGAGAAALAALHPLDFDPDDKWDFAAGYGNYNGENAAAIGAYYRPNEDTMFSVGGSFGNGENMVNAGVSLKLGQGNHVSTSKVAMAKEIKDLRKELEGLKSALLDVNAGKKLDTSKLQLFPDVPKNHWAYEYVSTLKGNGVLTGYPDGEFKGDRPMTRYEFATMLYKAMLEGATLSDKILKEFAPELERFTVDTVHQDKDGKPTVERVRTVKAEK